MEPKHKRVAARSSNLKTGYEQSTTGRHIVRLSTIQPAVFGIPRSLFHVGNAGQLGGCKAGMYLLRPI